MSTSSAPRYTSHVHCVPESTVLQLLEATYSGMIGGINGFHSGVGFRSSNGSMWQFEFDAINFNQAVVPQVNYLLVLTV